MGLRRPGWTADADTMCLGFSLRSRARRSIMALGVVLALRRLGHRHALHHGPPTKKTLLALVDHVGEDGLTVSFPAPGTPNVGFGVPMNP